MGNMAPRFWLRDGNNIKLTDDFELGNIDFQFQFTPTNDDISDIYGQERCSFKILARENKAEDTYFDPAAGGTADYTNVEADSDLTEG